MKVSLVLSGKVLRRGFIRSVPSSSLGEEVVAVLGTAESSSTGEISPARVCEKGKVASRHHSSEKGMLWRGFLLRQSPGVVPERCRSCLPESPKAEVVRQVVATVASGPPVDDEVALSSPVASVAASVKFLVDDAVPSDAPLDSVVARLKDDVVPPVVSAVVDFDAVPPDALVARGKHFYFPPVKKSHNHHITIFKKKKKKKLGKAHQPS